MGPTAELEAAMKRFDRLARLNRLTYRVTSVYRDPVKQKKLWDAYQLKLALGQPTLPAAHPGCSAHEYGVAVDMVPTDPRNLETMVALARYAGLYWFGPKDRVHFDLYGRAWPGIVHQLGRC
jgi:LAS superfamily LD-carboxypeptidase LdcB